MKFNLFSFNKGVEAYKKKDYYSAIMYFGKAISENSDSIYVQAYLYRAYNYSNVDMHYEAIKDLNMVEEYIKDDISFYIARASNHHMLKDYDRALKDYLSCLKIDENHYETNVNLYLVYKDLNKFDEALFYIDKVIQIRPSDLALNEKQNLINTLKS